MFDPVSGVIKGHYRAFLFDMDGTLLNSIAAAERVWTIWAERHGLDVAAFLPTIHGARAVDTIARLGLPGVDAVAEAAWVAQAEVADIAGVVEVAGAARFLQSLPADRWAIVTSAPKALALARMGAAGIPQPAVMVTAEDVAVGKPNPDCFLLAARRLGVDATDCLVFEDAAVGIRAGEAAGASVMVVTAAHPHPLATSHPTIAGYDTLRASVDESGRLLLWEPAPA